MVPREPWGDLQQSRPIASRSSPAQRNVPCLSFLRTNPAKKPSTAFSQELKIGAIGKFGANLFVLAGDWLPRMAWIGALGGMPLRLQSGVIVPFSVTGQVRAGVSCPEAAVDTFLHEALLPAPDPLPRLAARPRNAVPRPWSVSGMMWARHACFCGRFLSAAIRCSAAGRRMIP